MTKQEFETAKEYYETINLCASIKSQIKDICMQERYLGSDILKLCSKDSLFKEKLCSLLDEVNDDISKKLAVM